MVVSFTRTAAQEIRGRDLPIPEKMVGTLHSMAYRSIDSPQVAQAALKDWNDRHPQWAMKPGSGSGSIEESPAEWVGASEGEKLLGEVDILRSRMVPPELWPRLSLIGFHNAWTEWKREADVVDFTDMIEMALADVDEAPGKPKVAFLDEAQDATPLETALFRKWGAKMERVILIGDDDQAQAPWTKVLTTTGEVRMDELDPTKHRLVSYDLRGARIAGKRDGFAFEIAVHQDGRRGLVVGVGGRTTECTPDHRWWAKVDPNTDLHFVYLMRKGDRWRVGWCQARRSDGTAHLPVRARLEGADAAWVLSYHASRTEASIWESIFAARYGLPLNTFRPVANATHATAEAINTIYKHLDPVEQGERALRCLADNRRMVEHPFWEPGRNSVYGRQINQVRACNLIPGYHLLPVTDGGGAAWLPISTDWGDPIPVAYSVNVEPHHTYIADGIITANCLYRFRGADPSTLLDLGVPESDQIILDQSHRVPERVLEVADDWVHKLTRRAEKRYLPRDAEGKVTLSSSSFADVDDLVLEIRERLDAGLSVMAMTACSYQLDPLKHELKRQGVPFQNRYRRSRGDWNPMAPSTGRATSSVDRLVAYLIMDEDAFGDLSRLWTGRDVKAWSKFVRSSGVFRRGAKGAIEGLPDRELTYEEVAQLFASEEELETAVEPSLDWFASHLTAEGQRALEFPIAVYRRSGPSALVSEPRLEIGTIHSFKGGQADSVFVCPDLSYAGAREWDAEGEARDSVIRQFYVAMTRARDELVICQPSTNLNAPIFEGIKP